MEMVRLARVFAMLSILALAASAADFSLTIGPPVAAAGPAASSTGSVALVKKFSKAALFAVRMEECNAVDKAEIGGTAESVIRGARASAPVTLLPTGSSGVYVVDLDSRPQGVWVVNLIAACGGAKAGAIVPMGPQGFQRDGVKVLPRLATKAEIDAALAALEK